MTDSLLDQLKRLVTPEIVARVGGALGESEENVTKGFGAAIPALLSGLVSRASEGQGAERILSLVNDTDNDGAVLSNTEFLLSDTVATTPLHGLGQTLMGGLFSGKSEEVAQGIAAESGLQKGSALKILGFLSPLLLGLLGKNLGPGAAPASLLGLVAAQKDSILSALPGAFADQLGSTLNLSILREPAATTAVSSMVDRGGSLAVDATPTVTPAVIETPVVATQIVEPAVVEAPIVETPIVEPVVEPVVVNIEPVTFTIPTGLEEPVVPEEVSVSVPEEVIERPEEAALPVENVETVNDSVEEVSPADSAPMVFEPVPIEPVEEAPDSTEVIATAPTAELPDEDVPVMDMGQTEPDTEPFFLETPNEVVDTVPDAAPDFSEEPTVTVPELVESTETPEPLVETEMVPYVEPVHPGEEALGTVPEVVSDTTDHRVGPANVMIKPEPTVGFPKWGIPVFAVVALGVLSFFLLKGRNPAASSGKPEASPMVSASPGAVPPSTTPEATAEIKLPDSKTLIGIPGGTEDKLVALIKDASKPVDKDTWFDFDRLDFEVGKATLKPTSRPQIENIVAVLQAYPNVNLKIGGYTDNSGVKEANLKFSTARATSVRNAITGRGIPKDRVEAEGYGDQYPACPANDTEDCRKKNRRVAVRVTKK